MQLTWVQLRNLWLILLSDTISHSVDVFSQFLDWLGHSDCFNVLHSSSQLLFTWAKRHASRTLKAACLVLTSKQLAAWVVFTIARLTRDSNAVPFIFALLFLPVTRLLQLVVCAIYIAHWVRVVNLHVKYLSFDMFTNIVKAVLIESIVVVNIKQLLTDVCFTKSGEKASTHIYRVGLHCAG